MFFILLILFQFVLISSVFNFPSIFSKQIVMSSENSNKCLAHTNPSPPLFPLPQIIVIFFDGILAYRFLIISANCNPAFSIKINFDILSREGVTFQKLRSIWSKIPKASKNEEEHLEISAHYSGYLEKQKADIIAFRRDENLLIPDFVDYEKLSGLSNEVKSKFKRIRPKTLGQALRIDGITPAAVYILLSHVKRGHQKLNRA